MSAPRPLEEQLLRAAASYLDQAAAELPTDDEYEARLQILEGAAARLGAFPVEGYFKRFGTRPIAKLSLLDGHASKVIQLIKALPIPPALALSSLSRKPLTAQAQREAGAYYTDFRLAAFVAETGKKLWDGQRPIVDPACGAGILLAASTLAICGPDRQKTADFLAHQVIAADVSADALRGACLSLASLTNNLDAIVHMRSRWLQGDSLVRSESAWDEVAPDGFGLVVANPPWEKLKVSRHEYAKSKGNDRHYGAAHDEAHLDGFSAERDKTSAYARELALRYPSAANGELDLYAAFVGLFLRLARNGGGVAALVPAGLIRSEGTAALRRDLLEATHRLEIAILENRSRFFAIDTRFKFLALGGQTRAAADPEGLQTLSLAHVTGTETGVALAGEAQISCSELRHFRADLTVPEVRSSEEWRLFAEMSRRGVRWHADDSPWAPDFCREVDMTKERPKFRPQAAPGALPLIEGRMVHQHRYGAKRYVSGSGRRALWLPQAVGASQISPQHWIAVQDLPAKARFRAQMARAGFCDITGQTNERTMMAALIPAGVACGNKVPTVLFNDDASGEKLPLWVGMVNSLPFDWLMRRVVTTTVNYFLLRGVPLPDIEVTSLPGKEIVKSVRALQALDGAGSSMDAAWRIAEYRARIDLLCLIGYGAGYDDLALMVSDFPLLDRSQPPLPGEPRSTVTRDFLLLTAARRCRRPTEALLQRVKAAKALGAIPYIPSQSDVTEEEQDDSRAG